MLLSDFRKIAKRKSIN